MFRADEIEIPTFVRKKRQYLSVVEALWDGPLTVMEIETKIRKKFKRYPNRQAIACWLGKNPHHFRVIKQVKMKGYRAQNVWEYIGGKNVVDRKIQTE